ncbi:multiheme c-type cytochrome [Aliidiomarina indica]|uniref:multiheme c-type cytochrome n=1 Tax=Aliidiomarina indica TaxID=2749147 RepID=UPI00188FD756|nr:cytochrome c3 family protein [Aliidiomarina indica]
MLTARWLYLSFAIVLAVIIGAFQFTAFERQPSVTANVQEASEWVSESDCAQCHQAQFQDWQNSHHQLAMLAPTYSSVRAAFLNTSFDTAGELFNFSKQDQQYFVNVLKDGQAEQNYQIAYTFGWEPLQQYLVQEEETGALQALPIAWDTEQEHWFQLYEDMHITAEHPLHWQRAAQNATVQCVECHTSGYQVHYAPETNTYETQWQSLGVGCQACHGPAKGHLQWLVNENDDPHKGFHSSLQPNSGQQVATCAQCHSRRTALGDLKPSEDFHDQYLLSLLTADLYEVNGTIKDEVFEYGSFIQSKMHEQGVVCSDCHNPHSGELKASGNGVCLQCHNPQLAAPRPDFNKSGLLAVDYQSELHHFHASASVGSQCSSCHMPSKFYMGNDLRHDHSFSIPNPKQALELGHPDACLSCHQGDNPDIIVAAFTERYPDYVAADGGFARTLYTARHGKPDAVKALLFQLLRTDLPPMRYAALIAETPNYPAEPLSQQVMQSLQHTSPLVRRAALQASVAFAAPMQLQLVLQQMRSDTSRSVRMVASELTIEHALETGQPIAAGELAEFVSVQTELMGRPEAHFSLAGFYQATQQTEQAVSALQQALTIEPGFSPAIVANAQALEALSPAGGLQYLEGQAEQWPQVAELQFALALARIRSGSLTGGIQALQRAFAIAPENDYYAYVLAVAWHGAGEVERAQQILRSQLQNSPQNGQLRLTLIDYLNDETEKQMLRSELELQNPYDPLIWQQDTQGQE